MSQSVEQRLSEVDKVPTIAYLLSMPIALKRVYDEPSANDGYRVLVDRLWPRGVTKERAMLDEWPKEITPSDELRKWIHVDPTQWSEFKKRYHAELKPHKAELLALAKRAKKGKVTLLTAAKEMDKNHATVLKAYLEKLG